LRRDSVPSFVSRTEPFEVHNLIPFDDCQGKARNTMPLHLRTHERIDLHHI
jgi:hypothetical protein